MHLAQLFLNISFLSSLPFPLDNSSLSENSVSKNQTYSNRTLLKILKREVMGDNYQLAREAYEREVNDSITDYYAQRKAVMNTYHARQRAIADKFTEKSTTLKPDVVSTADKMDFFHGFSPRSQDDAPSNNVVRH